MFSRIFIISLSLFFVAPSVAGAEYYLIDGLENYSPYSVAILELNWEEDSGAVTGSIQPQLGDKTKPVNVSGNNSVPGELSLTILTEPSQTLQFTKKLSKYEVWWATDWLDDDFPGGVSFRRPRGAELSEASLTQQIQGCGPITGSVSMIPNAEKFFKASGNMNISAEILGLPITEWVCDDETGECTEIELRSLGEELAIATANLERDDENISAEEAGYVDIWGNSTIRVGVPTGTESHIIRSLRESELFDWVNLTPEACGGSHRSLFAIKKSLVQVGGEFAANGFKDRMVSGLSGFFSQKMGGDQYEGRVQSIDISRVNIPPFPIHVKMDLTVASEITRGVGGYWDKFKVHFEPADTSENDNTELAVVTWISRLRSSKRSPGNSSPPSDESWYSILHPEEVESVPTVSVSHFMSKFLDGWCYYNEEGYEPQSHVAEKCLPVGRF